MRRLPRACISWSFPLLKVNTQNDDVFSTSMRRLHTFRVETTAKHTMYTNYTARLSVVCVRLRQRSQLTSAVCGP